MTVVVTGATGLVGRRLVERLRLEGEPVRAVTRDPGRARLPGDVEVVQGDLGSPERMAEVFAGADRLHLMTTHEPAQLDAAPAVARSARDAGVRRVTVMSGGGDETQLDAVRAAGLPWTHLQPGEFMANTLDWAHQIRDQEVVRAPFGGWLSAMIHEDDIAAVAQAALTSGGHDGDTYILTCEEELTRVEVVRLIGAAIGRDIRFEELTPEQARSYWTSEEGYPDEVVDWFLELGSGPGPVSAATKTIREVTGRPARTFAEWAEEHADDFR